MTAPRSPSDLLLPLMAAAIVGATGGCSKQRQDRRWVDKIELRGARQLSADDVLDGLALQQTGWWPFADKKWFDAATLDRDLERIEGFYAAHGFFRARVVSHEVKRRPDEPSVEVVLEVEEGRPTEIAALEIVGLDDIPADHRRQATDDLGLAVGQRFDQNRYAGTKALIKARLQRLGYAYAKIDGRVGVDRDAREARVRIEAKPGPRVKFGEIKVKGSGELPSHKIADMVLWNKGDIYDRRVVEDTRSRLLDVGAFSSVNIELPKTPSTQPPITVKVAPATLHELRLGGGLGVEQRRQEVRLSGQWTIHNFLGGLRRLSLRVRPAYVAIPSIWDAARSGPAVTSTLKLEQPDWFGTGITAFAAFGYDLDVQPGYNMHGPHAHLGIERPFFYDLLRLGLSWNFQYFDFFSIDDNAFVRSKTPLGLGFVDPYRVAWLQQDITLDLRDTPIDPRSGGFARIVVEEGAPYVAGAFTYLKVLPELRGYIPLGTTRLILALRGQLGYLRPIDPEDSPITRRIFLGGPTSHRGFSYGRLAPQTYDEPSGRYVPLGGNASVLFQGDLRFRLVRLFDNWLNVVTFLDAGDVVAKLDQLDFAQLHLAVGGGLYYQTPIGVVRVALGVRLNRVSLQGPDGRTNPDPGNRYAFHLTLGEAF